MHKEPETKPREILDMFDALQNEMHDLILAAWARSENRTWTKFKNIETRLKAIFASYSNMQG